MKSSTKFEILLYEANRIKVLIGNHVYWYEGIPPYKYEKLKVIRRKSSGNAIQFLEKEAKRIWKAEPITGVIKPIERNRRASGNVSDSERNGKRMDSFQQDAFCFE